MNVSRWIFALALVAMVLAASSAVAQDAESDAETAPASAEADRHGKDAAAHDDHAGGDHPSEPNPMAFDPDLAIFSAVIFLLLLLILGKFAWPPIVAALDARERKIADNIAAAAAKLEDAKRLLAEHEAKLGAAAGEVRAMLDEARRDAEHTRKRIETEGHQAAKDEMDRAVREIKRASDAAVQELAVASAKVAVDLARGVVRQEISPERQNEIVRDAIGKLKAAAPSSN